MRSANHLAEVSVSTTVAAAVTCVCLLVGQSRAASNARRPVSPVRPAGPRILYGAKAGLVFGPRRIARPAGSVKVTPDQNLQQVIASHPDGTVFWLTAGVYTNGVTNIMAKPMALVGEKGAIIDGRGANAFFLMCDGGPSSLANVTVQNLEVRGFMPPMQTAAINIPDTDGGMNRALEPENGIHHLWTIRNCSFHDNRIGLFAGPGTLVQGCSFVHNTMVGAKACGAHVTYSGCLFRDNQGEDGGIGEHGGIKVWNTRDLLMENCVFERNEQVGFWADHAYGNNVVRHCTFRNHPKGGVEVELTASAEVSYCLFEGNSARGGDQWIDGQAFAFNAPVHFHHNKMVGRGGWVLQNGTRFWPDGPNPTPTCEGSVVEYNDVTMTAGYSGAYCITADAIQTPEYYKRFLGWSREAGGDGTPPGFKADHNVYRGSGYESNRGTNNQFDDKKLRFVYGFPLERAQADDPRSWTAWRYMGWDDYRRLTPQDAHSRLVPSK